MNTTSLFAPVTPPVMSPTPRFPLTRCVGVSALAVLISACGGGGNELVSATASALNSSVPPNVPAGVFTPTPGSNGASTSPVAPAPAPSDTTPPVQFTPGGGATVGIGAKITDIQLQNTGAAQTDVPFTFGQVVAEGAMRPSDGLVAKLADGSTVGLQADVKATHADGSVRHVVISGVLPALAAGQSQTLELFKTERVDTNTATPQLLLDKGLSSKITITVDNVKYSATLTEAMADPARLTWLAGKVANEWIASAPLKDSTGVHHPALTARFAVRWYQGLEKQARVDAIVENTKTFVSGRNVTYDVDVNLGGRSVYAKTGLTHYQHSRWHKSAWWNPITEPALNIRHNTAYLIATKAVPNYDQSIIPSEKVLTKFGNQLNETNVGPMTIGPANKSMHTSGGRGDIGPLPSWTVMHLLSMDKRAWDVMMAGADGSGTWSIHYRDENTGQPIRTDNEINKSISLHGNMAKQGPLPVPRCAADSTCATPNASDTAHQPSLVYMPYVLTGDYYYLEELQFWAARNPLATAPGNHDGKGLIRWQQVRGQAWSLRTLGHTAYITPDTHPLKDYFTKQLDHNLAFYHQTYVVGNPNQLGVYDGSGAGASQVDGSAPWQDDYLTWSFGYLAELGFTKATPILQWKAKYAVGRMTAPGFCWISGADYYLNFRASPTTPLYATFAELYFANFGGATIKNDSRKSIQNPDGSRYIDQPCGSQAQADWLTAANGRKWTLGQMMGYASSTLGYPSNMQPALAVAATSGIPEAARAWEVFINRTVKPDYTTAPQFAIVPR